MEILTTREWATVIWAFILFVYAMAHRQIREAFWNVVKIFFGKKLRILWGIIFLYVLGITLIFYQLPFAYGHFPRPSGPRSPARQGHIKRPVLRLAEPSFLRPANQCC